MQKKINKKNTAAIAVLVLASVLVFITVITLHNNFFTSPEGHKHQPLFGDREAMGGDIDDPVNLITYNPGDIDLDYLIESMSFLQNPLPGTVMSYRDAHLPNSPRPYRSGTHYGIDFYAETSGGGITLGTEIRAAAPGTVVRIDHDYIMPTPQQLGQLSIECRELGKTPDYALDIFRGRQIWIENKKGFVIYYCHLHDVSESLQTGDYVQDGDIIGTMGYSGTNEPDRPHLHLEIWFGDIFLGEGMTPDQLREFFGETIFIE